MNTSAPWPDLAEAESRVLKIQTKLHQWAIDDGDRCFDDLHNFVCDPAFLLVGWSRVFGATEADDPLVSMEWLPARSTPLRSCGSSPS